MNTIESVLLVIVSAILGGLSVIQWQAMRSNKEFRRDWEEIMKKQQRPFGEVSHEEDSFHHQL
ncbi:MAG: hypothetical protein RLY20_2950 [Verrucomicrobiota bacterium]|jgi:hypothetical protein